MIYRLLALMLRGLTLDEVAATLDISPSQVSAMLHTLERGGYVECRVEAGCSTGSGAEGCLACGLRAFCLSAGGRHRADRPAIANEGRSAAAGGAGDMLRHASTRGGVWFITDKGRKAVMQRQGLA